MKQRIVAALFLAGFASASLAQGAQSAPASTPQGSSVPEFDTVIVQNADSCPAGFYPSVPSYTFQDGHLVQNGWACDSLYRDDQE